MSSAPLNGVRVLDLSRLLPGPFATQILRDLGAEVIKVEDPALGDYARNMPPLADDNQAAAYHSLNRGKKSIALDLKLPADKAKFLALLSTADVLVESFRPGVMEKLGLGYASLSKKFPGLVFCSISGYGQTGPDSLRAGHDINYLARAGVLGVMKNPVPLPVQVADICGGAYPAAVQILAALRHKEKTGQGAFIDVSMADNSFALLNMPVARHAADSSIGFTSDEDTLAGAVPCYNVYKSKDGFIAVGALEPKFWNQLVKAVGLPHLADRGLSTGAEGAAVMAELQAVLQSKTDAEWTQFLKKHDVCVEVINKTDGVWKTDPQMAARPLMLSIKTSPTGSALEIPAMPLNMTGVKPVLEKGPQLGEHTEEILQKLKSKL